MKKLISQWLGFTLPKPTKTVYTVLRQLVQWIPPGMIQRLADEHRLDIRKWSAVSHVVALMYGQLAGWKLSFSRLAGVARAAVWVKRDLVAILKTYGTAPQPEPGESHGPPPPLQVFFDFWRLDYGTVGP
jgi:hypothetical protein